MVTLPSNRIRLVAFLCCLTSAVLCTSAHAQSRKPKVPVKPKPKAAAPPRPLTVELDASADLTQEAPARRAVAAFKQKVAPLELNRPQDALRLYQSAVEKNLDLHPSAVLELLASIVALQEGALGDAPKAVAIATWALTKYNDNPHRVVLVPCLARAYVAQAATDKAEQLIIDNWGLLLRAGNYPDAVHQSLDQYEIILTKLARKSQFLPSVQQGLLQAPGILDDAPWNAGPAFYDFIIDKYLALKDTDQALKWAKLRYVLCTFDDWYLTRATGSVAKVLQAKDPTATLAPTRAPGPHAAVKSALADVTLPTLADDATIDTLLTQASGDESWQRHDRVTLLLLAGRTDDALRSAETWLLAAPTSPDAVREICRVFKSADLDTQRATTFLNAAPDTRTSLLKSFHDQHAPTP